MSPVCRFLHFLHDLAVPSWSWSSALPEISLLHSLENEQQVRRVLHAHSHSLFHSSGCNWWTQQCRTNIAPIITCCLLDPQVARGQGSFGGSQNKAIGLWWTHTAISSCGSPHWKYWCGYWASLAKRMQFVVLASCIYSILLIYSFRHHKWCISLCSFIDWRKDSIWQQFQESLQVVQDAVELLTASQDTSDTLP